MYPTFEEIRALHKKYAPDDRLFHLVFTHCKIVQDISLQIIKNKQLDVNEHLVLSGALLHDIGTYQFIQQYEATGQSKYYQHAFEGYRILKEEKLPEDLCLLVLHHMRLGLTKDQVEYEQLDLPVKDYSPTTIEEKIVMYADKFHSKQPQFNSYESYKSFVSQFGEQQIHKLEALAGEFGIPDIEGFAKQYNHPLV